jgi:hypothetical protein
LELPAEACLAGHIVLLTAAGCGTAEIMRRARVSKTAIWRWQERYMSPA